MKTQCQKNASRCLCGSSTPFFELVRHVQGQPLGPLTLSVQGKNYKHSGMNDVIRRRFINFIVRGAFSRAPKPVDARSRQYRLFLHVTPSFKKIKPRKDYSTVHFFLLFIRRPLSYNETGKNKLLFWPRSTRFFFDPWNFFRGTQELFILPFLWSLPTFSAGVGPTKKIKIYFRFYFQYFILLSPPTIGLPWDTAQRILQRRDTPTLHCWTVPAS